MVGRQIRTPDLLRPRQLQKIYLVGSSSFVLRHGTRFWTQFVSIWTQMDPSFFSQLGRRQAGAEISCLPDGNGFIVAPLRDRSLVKSMRITPSVR